jgi:hypothetical protein
MISSHLLAEERLIPGRAKLRAMRILVIGAAVVLLASHLIATEPTPETRRWWNHVVALANDGMEGRDTGSEGYLRAARYVVTAFERYGLKPAFEGGYYQTVPLHVVRLRAGESRAELVRGNTTRRLTWLHQITVTANTSLPASIDTPMVFVGSPGWEREVDVKGKIVVQFSPTQRVEKPRQPVLTAPPPGSTGLLGIDDLSALEPRRWPVQYSVAMRLSDATAAAYRGLVMAFNPAFAEWLFEGSGHSFREIMDLYKQEKRVPNFALPSTFRASLRVEEADLESPNLAASLPGSDPALANEYIVLSAHLDGYGFGEPWGGDRIYNGAFDDAAYVALLLETAERIRESKASFRRSILFAVFTGEEKGLLGSRYFTEHPPVPRERLVANINLDQVRPLFPLKVLTVVALDESTLGGTIRQVASEMGIRIQVDAEPWRSLIQRADNWNFMRLGVPAVGFVLGRDSAKDEEIYKEWYARRYHTPLDDLKQPWDPSAAARFNDFFEKLVAALANAPDRPSWRPGSEFARR